MTFSRYKLFDTAFKMDKDKKTVGSLSSGDFESNDFLIKQGRGKTRDVVINNFSKKFEDVLVMIGMLKDVVKNSSWHLMNRIWAQ